MAESAKLASSAFAIRCGGMRYQHAPKPCASSRDCRDDFALACLNWSKLSSDSRAAPQQVVLEQSLGRLRPSGGAAQYADAAALGPAGALRGSSTLVLSGSNWRLLLLSALSIASKYMDDDHLCFVQLIRMHASHVLKPPLRTARQPEPHPGRLFRARLAALWLPDTLSHQLGAFPDQRPLTIQALRQLMCPPAAAAAAGRAAQRPRWAGRWRGRWRGLRERLLRLWATARAAAQLLRLRAS